MELRDIRTFLTLAEELHFGRTARRMMVTQGRVSQTIRALEREVGGELFERTSRQVRLTPLGRRFLRGVGEGYETLVRTLQECQASARVSRGLVRIGYAATIGAGFAARVANDFEARHPGHSTTLNAIRILQPDIALENEDIDVLLIWSPGGDAAALRGLKPTAGAVLGTVPRGVLVPIGHPLSGRSEVSLEDLADYELLWPHETVTTPEIYDLWIPRFTPSGRPLRRTAQNLMTMTGKRDILADDVITLVARGRGIHLTVVSLLQQLPFPDLTVIPVTDMPPMAIVPLWSAGDDNPAVRVFAEFATGFRHRDESRSAATGKGATGEQPVER
ncbi:LysR family transcriptional regulator [Actinoallomurus soli]|uniref:LysR family transcriptional regulator n=1 Tax=Actinoallomurus soli TaxID=2952535 RepID=UPI002092433B|nr:LysR family transcriptional regulator [Actinoallomurus soli]MCO5970132.1 LysR family transcriptional regulator [Actinoallomurus soli]